MAIWKKNTDSHSSVTDFTVGRDREFDLQLAPFDILGSIAHVTMLAEVNLIEAEEKNKVVQELRKLYADVEAGKFTIDESEEDIHSQVESILTKTLGDAGKKIHSARSRNDQVLVDIKLYLRKQLTDLVFSVNDLFQLLQAKSEAHKQDLLPGYTHLQLAMPSSFGLWFGAYAEALVDDVITLKSAYDITNKNPLGSAAGYGSSFPINRTRTTELLGFDSLHYNVVYAQMSRGKTERIVASALSNVADTLARMSMDVCLFMNQHFGFVNFPAELTTGSSIMPHKKNPDVFELIRAKCNQVKAIPNEIMLITTNLPSGYHRDLQILKEHLFPAFQTLKDCIKMAMLMFENMEVKKDILQDEKFKYLYSVEEVNKLVLQGMPFRDAYKKVGADIEAGKFTYDTNLKHTHEGSIGNLMNDHIKKEMETVLAGFNFKKVEEAVAKLLR